MIKTNGVDKTIMNFHQQDNGIVLENIIFQGQIGEKGTAIIKVKLKSGCKGGKGIWIYSNIQVNNEHDEVICSNDDKDVEEEKSDSNSNPGEPSSNTNGNKTVPTKSKKRIRGNKGGRKRKRAKVNRIAVKENVSSGANVRAETSDSEEEMEITPTVLESQTMASNEETIVQENNEEQVTSTQGNDLVQVFKKCKKELEGSENDSLDNILNSKSGVFNDHFSKYFDVKKQTE
jgi:hypothetical protein